MSTPLEADQLAVICECAPVVECASIYDGLRDGLTEAQADYQTARRRGVAGQADADKAVGEMIAITELLHVIVDCLAWRRHIYRAHGRLWPITPEQCPDHVPTWVPDYVPS